METGKVILVVDDDRDFQTILKASFGKNGFEVRSVYNGAIGEALDKGPLPDIILLDIDLPLANGVEVGKQLKAHASTKNIPVILVSANPFVDNLCKEAGAADFVQKPFTLKALIEKVEQNLALSA